MHVPKTWDARLEKTVKMLKAGGTGGPPVEGAPKPPKAPAFKIPADVVVRPVTFPRAKFDGLEDIGKDQGGEVQAEWVEPKGAHGGFAIPTIIYLHGGGFWGSSPEEHRFITVPFVKHSAGAVKLLVVDYRLSPANPFPSALIDALSVYQHLIMEGICEPDMLFFAGDSAGGNLCLTTTMWLRDHPELDLPTPKGLVLLSPWLDQHRSSPTISLDDEFTACLTDGMKVGDVLEEPGPLPYIKYAKGAKHTDPLVSPLYDNGNLPPIMIAVGTVDRFIGECLAEGIKQVQKGDTVIMDYYEDQVHVFQGYHWVPLTTTFFNRAIHFVKELSESTPQFTSVNFISIADGSVKTLAEGETESVAEMQARLGGYLDRQKKAGKDKGAWKNIKFYKQLAGGEAKL